MAVSIKRATLQLHAALRRWSCLHTVELFDERRRHKQVVVFFTFQ